MALPKKSLRKASKRQISGPRKQPSQTRSEETVNAILEGATRVLLKEGFDRASTNKIAKAAGVSIGSLYQYFPNKDAIISELVDRHIEERVAFFQSQVLANLDQPIRQAISNIIMAIINYQRSQPDRNRILLEQVPRIYEASYVHKLQKNSQVLVRTALEAKRSELRPKDLEIAAFLLVQTGISATYLAGCEPYNFLHKEEFAQELHDMFLRYLLNEKKDSP